MRERFLINKRGERTIPLIKDVDDVGQLNFVSIWQVSSVLFYKIMDI